MESSFNYINNKAYIKYLEEFNNYYTLKNSYENYKNNLKKNIIEDNDKKIDEKKTSISKLKYKCINCKSEGGTIFKNENNILIAICGNIKNPCNLNIKLEKKNYLNLKEEIVRTSQEIYDLKKNILIIKLDVLFNYISEEKAIELFNKLSNKLNSVQELYYKYSEQYKKITDSKEVEELLKERQDYMNDVDEYYLLYNENKDTKYLNDIHNIYLNKIKIVDKKIFEQKYKYCKVEKNNEILTNTLKLEKKNLNEFLFLNNYNI
tara:strand:- start:2061 stop:2849 length:789 start_codon:yes stop_codon:yes gene_type:complete